MATLTYKLESDVSGNTVEITKDTFTVGRHGDLETPLGLTCISRLHFAIFPHSLPVSVNEQFINDGKPYAYSIRDLNSHCGTRVNDKDIGKASVKLNDGDEIIIGIDARPKMILKFIK